MSRRVRKKNLPPSLIKAPDHSHDGFGVYLIESSVSGVSYVGSSKHCLLRLRQHENELRNGIHYNERLQAEYDKGFPLGCNIIPCETREEAYALEQKMLDDCFGNPLCLNSSAYARLEGSKMSLDTRRKMSQFQKEHAKKPEVRERLRQKALREGISPETRRKMLEGRRRYLDRQRALKESVAT